jgi:predicted MFS family arabinose efflux permease
MERPEKKVFSSYEVLIITIITLTQFTVVLDFMVLSPLGALLMPRLSISPQQFAAVVSGYAFSAGLSGFLAAAFADKFDRKKILIFFYTGFIIGTFACGIASDYHFLLLARIFTGVFGGVISSISFAIITDLFPLQVRGRVMGFVQMAFAASQVLGIPLGFYLAEKWDWHIPFLMIVGLSVIVGVLIVVKMKPINNLVTTKREQNPFRHLFTTVTNKTYLKGFAATILLATGGFMLMPFGSAYSVNNLGLDPKQLTPLYLITGVFSMIAGPFIGKLSDGIGKYKVFFIGSVVLIIITVIYCNLGPTPFWIVTLISVIMFIGVSARIISSQALITAVPEPKDRGAYMSINSSVQQVSGGIATTIAGLIVVEDKNHLLQNYSTLGYVVVGATLITLLLFYFIHLMVRKKEKTVTVV